jgi:aminoglycoside 6'-N-acetyltransferase I
MTWSLHRVASNDAFFAAYCRLRIALWPDCAEDCVSEAVKMVTDAEHGVAFLALTETNEPIGFIEVSLRSCAESATISPVPFIEGWFVESSHRRYGVGRFLVNAAEQWAAARGFGEIASDTQIENTGSIAAHLRLRY